MINPNRDPLLPPRREERRTASPEHRAAYAAAKNAPTEHKPTLVTAKSVNTSVHGAGPVGRLNAWLAVRITSVVGTMYCAYVFTVIAFVALPAAIQQGSPTVLINWLSSNFLQLVLLPIIIVGQNVISASQDARAEADHLTLTTLHAMNVRQLQMLEQQAEILKQQREILDMMKKTA